MEWNANRIIKGSKTIMEAVRKQLSDYIQYRLDQKQRQLKIKFIKILTITIIGAITLWLIQTS